MKKAHLLFLSLTTVLFSCNPVTSNEENTFLDNPEKTTEVEFIDQTKVASNASVKLNIEGMTCEMGCGSVIRKNLYNTGAIEQCAFDFQENRESNTVEVLFDSTKIEPTQIIAVINSIEEGDFTASNSN
ncbi:MAG: heavy-metal-associated domain-containing protein [Lishizhenia sp.]